MDFLSSTTYWFLCVPVSVIFGTATIISMHPKILERNPNALALNNLMIIIGIGLLVGIFVFYSWLAGLTCIVLSIVGIGVGVRIRERIFFNKLRPSNKTG